MKLFRRMLLVSLVVGGITAAVIFTRERNGAAASVPETAAVIEFAPTDLAQAQVRDIVRTLPLTGTFNPMNWAYVKSREAGDVREVRVREGESVRKGQILARIDVTELEARMQERIGNLESSRAQLDLAQKVQINNRQLLQQGFISQNAFDNSQSSYLQAKGAVKANKAQVALARKALDDSIIRAPIDGIVAERLVQPGEKVPVDAKLFTLMDLSRMELAASIPAGEIGNVQLGQPVAFHVEGFAERTFTGRIDRINPATQNGSRSIPVYAVIDNSDRSLKGGMFAKGAITVGKLASVMTVPGSAVYQENGQTLVYMVENETLKKQPVKLGLRSEETGLVEVVEGLKPATTVVNGNFANLRQGSKVRVSQLAGK